MNWRKGSVVTLVELYKHRVRAFYVFQNSCSDIASETFVLPSKIIALSFSHIH